MMANNYNRSIQNKDLFISSEYSNNSSINDLKGDK